MTLTQQQKNALFARLWNAWMKCYDSYGTQWYDAWYADYLEVDKQLRDLGLQNEYCEWKAQQLKK